MVSVTQSNACTVYHHEFRTHSRGLLDSCFSWVRERSEPLGRFAHQVARVILHPKPGGDESSRLARLAARADALARAILLILPALKVSCLLIFPYFLLERLRPTMSVIQPIQRPEPIEEISFLSFNTLLMPKFACTGNHIEGALARAHAIADHLLSMDSPPTVLAMQEVFDVEATEVLVTRLKERWPFIVHSVNPNPFRLSSGLMVLCQHPFRTPPSFTPFSSLVGDDRLSGKGFVRIPLATKEGPIILYNCHTQSGEGPARHDARAENLRQLLEAVKEDADCHQCPIFVTGDLNVDRRKTDQPFVDEFFSSFDDSCRAESGPDSSLWKIHRTDSQWGTSHWRPDTGLLEGERIDYVLRYTREDERDAPQLSGRVTDLFLRNSDHLAVIASYQPETQFRPEARRSLRDSSTRAAPMLAT